ncbi:unnamed protein product, partial [Brenthis ino]
MPLLKLLISFISLCTAVFLVPAYANPQRRKLPFPHLTNFDLSDIGKPIHIFEGIDYDQLPKNLKNEYSDCYADQKRCKRLRNHLNPVCGYDPMYRSFETYHSICELDLQNCHKMINGGLGKYGKNLWDRYIYFLGEGAYCEHLARSFRGMTDTENSTILAILKSVTSYE